MRAKCWVTSGYGAQDPTSPDGAILGGRLCWKGPEASAGLDGLVPSPRALEVQDSRENQWKGCILVESTLVSGLRKQAHLGGQPRSTLTSPPGPLLEDLRFSAGLILVMNFRSGSV